LLTNDALQNGSGKHIGVALVVEDNIMIALDIESVLQDLGVPNCFIANSVESALAVLETREIAFAVVDVDLGGVTSEEVVAALDARDLPFALATGYGEVPPGLASHGDVPVLMKPFSAETLAMVLKDIGVL